MATWKQVLTEADTTNTLADVHSAGGADGQVLIWDNGNSRYAPSTLTAGTGITVTNSAAGITIASSVTDTDDDVSTGNLISRLSEISENVTIGDANDVQVTIAGNLVVSGTTTTVNSTTVEVADKLIKLANVGSPTSTTGSGAGIQVEVSATEADFPEIKWTKDLGTGNTDGAGTGQGLTGWTISNMHTSNHTDNYIAVMGFSTSSAPSGNAGGVGSFHYDDGTDKLYIRTE